MGAEGGLQKLKGVVGGRQPYGGEGIYNRYAGGSCCVAAKGRETIITNRGGGKLKKGGVERVN